MCIADCIISPTPRPKASRARARALRRFLNAGSVDEIVFTRSATEAINLVAASYGLAHIGEGDEIILSVMEHHSNIVPWHFLRERKGAVLKWIEVDDDGSFSLDAFEKLLTKRTKIVALTHMSNVARRADSDQGSRAHRPRAWRSACWSTARRARCISMSTCRRSMSIFTW